LSDFSLSYSVWFEFIWRESWFDTINEQFVRLLGLFDCFLFNCWVCSTVGFVRPLGLFDFCACSTVGFIRLLSLFDFCVCSTVEFVRLLCLVDFCVCSEIVKSLFDCKFFIFMKVLFDSLLVRTK
jgi:hypothetical protein